MVIDRADLKKYYGVTYRSHNGMLSVNYKGEHCFSVFLKDIDIPVNEFLTNLVINGYFANLDETEEDADFEG